MKVLNIKLVLIYFSLLLGACMLMLTSCSDEAIDNPNSPYYPEFDENMVCLPIGMSYELSNQTLSGSTRDDVFEYSEDNAIDENTINSTENYAIFFDDNKNVKYVKPLFLADQLNNSVTSPSPNSERTLYAYAMVPKEEETVNYPAYMLVILNGSPVYDYVCNTIYNDRENDIVRNDCSLDEIMALTWWAPQYDMHNKIGINNNNHYTMTNSSYINEAQELVNIVPIDKTKTYLSFSDYFSSTDHAPAAEVYLERMVAKFYEPTFETDVIGSDKVFRPNEKALPLVVYSWNDEIPTSEQKTWRIHLLGWTINGEETANYLFKNIPDQISDLDGWDNWNRYSLKRSFWSIDPHYSSNKNSDGVYDFYPWQYRKAADKEETISIQTAENLNMIPALRYNTFDEVSWPPVRYIQENTYDPFGNWYINQNEVTNNGNVTKVTNETYLDGRETVLAGPHLLLTAELFFEEEGGNYIGQYSTVDHIYSDRLRRYYLNEADWFKMFVYEFNRALSTQEHMTFSVYDWDGNSSEKVNHTYTTHPTGECRLYYDGMPLTNERIDSIVDTGTRLSIEANVRNGDGRLIPWIDSKNENGERVTLRVRTAKQKELNYDSDNNNDNGSWDDNQYMSLFYEWFGPVDHYYKGYMYYAGEIKHYVPTNPTARTYYGTVRNHAYKFHVQNINSLGIPIDNTQQLIVPGKYAYSDQIGVYLHVLDWHSQDTSVELQ